MPKTLLINVLDTFLIVLVTGIEPVRCRHHRILSPARLPVPPRRQFNGQRWIRTTEAICSRFTVCPLWPLGNLPIYQFFNRLYIYTTLHTKVQVFFVLIRCEAALLSRAVHNLTEFTFQTLSGK